jgi:hypothetical protein
MLVHNTHVAVTLVVGGRGVEVWIQQQRIETGLECLTVARLVAFMT